MNFELRFYDDGDSRFDIFYQPCLEVALEPPWACRRGSLGRSARSISAQPIWLGSSAMGCNLLSSRSRVRARAHQHQPIARPSLLLIQRRSRRRSRTHQLLTHRLLIHPRYGTATPTFTYTPTETPSDTPTFTFTPTYTPTNTPTDTASTRQPKRRRIHSPLRLHPRLRIHLLRLSPTHQRTRRRIPQQLHRQPRIHQQRQPPQRRLILLQRRQRLFSWGM